FSYAGMQINVPSNVFHPGMYFSTTIFIEFLQSIDFQDKKVLDVGTGSGLLAMFAAQKNAFVTAVDINPAAVKIASANASENFLNIKFHCCDLFQDLSPDAVFDFILANPPYFAAAPRSMKEHAFFAGTNLEYFESFFSTVSRVMTETSKIWMILGTDCDLQKINHLATAAGFQNQVVFRRNKWGKELRVYQYTHAALPG
ncbi:MAG: methyltransferase, partial [Saprospiraceae bacterium]|nr:methyltransferase [Saprospiraceae bacterium]